MRLNTDLINKKQIVFLGIILTLCTIIGFLVGYFSGASGSNQSYSNSKEYLNFLIRDLNEATIENVKKLTNIENIKRHLKYLTSIPHTAGTDGDKFSAEYIAKQWKDQGLDLVHFIDYDMLMSYPDPEKANNIELYNVNRELVKRYEVIEPNYDYDLDFSLIPKPYLAYSPNGTVQSDELYYANHCREEDFDHLVKIGISIIGKIVLCKYGKGSRGYKVKFAEKYGAKGVLIYDDPMSSAPLSAKNSIYPNGDFLPPDGTQRGSIFTGSGDPLTPEYPSTEYAFRIDENKANLPSIPAQVIGYGIAYDLLKLIEQNGNSVIDGWRGEFNLTYKYGGKLKDYHKIFLNVFNLKKIEKNFNVIGIIKGSVEPDRYIICGNHRDAWGYGAIDPTSGTATLLEVSRILAYLKNKKKWRPRRTIIFMSWSAEEFTIGGSIEWVEEFQKKLIANGVSYINMDSVIMANYSYEAKASPLYSDLIYDVTKNIEINENETVYSRWFRNDPNDEKIAPKIKPLASGSDFMPFIQRVGIPSIDQAFVRNEENPNPIYKHVGWYATYHTSYETYQLVSKYIDPGFNAFKLMATISTELIRRLSDAYILPFNCNNYAKELEKAYMNFENKNLNYLNKININVEFFKNSVHNFTAVASAFTERLKNLDKKQYHLVRIYNDQLKNLEKSFLDHSGYKRSNYLHMIYAPSLSNSYGGMQFPGITDAIYNFMKNETSKDLKDKIKKQISIVTFAIQSACSILKEPIDFQRYI